MTADASIPFDPSVPESVVGNSRIVDIPRGTPSQAELLDITWRRPPGFWGWLTAVDHKEIGLRFIITAMIFFLLAGIMALLMRIQLAVPGNHFLGPDQYNQLFTTHGTTMMFLFAVPVMQGMGIYFVPMMIGARSVSFPRLLSYSYWCFVIAGIALYVGVITNTAPDMGWFSYLPLAGPAFSPGHRMDLWSQMVSLMEVSSLAAAIAVITTIFKQRVPGMSLNRMPIFVWTQLITGWMIIFAMPAVMLCSTLMSMDRLPHIGTHFYNSAEGGDPILWQHLFWFFAHPEVYIIFMPATAFVSTMVETFSKRPIFGYTALILSSTATAFIGFGVWVHHMFATPLPQLGEGLFTASSLMIVIPNAVQMYCWIATIWTGKVEVTLPMLFVFGFIAVFIIGGMTGVMLASVQLDLQVHDTMFVVAHLHYVLIGGAVFPLFGAFYYWFPKWTGRMMNNTMGLWNFILLFVGFNLTFWPLHHLGLHGMTRRIYTYRPESGWGPMNFVATCGAFTIGISVLLMLINMAWSRRRGKIAGPNPWHASMLEWATSSPPPAYNFENILTVRSREPLWRDPPDQPVVKGLSLTTRQVLITTTIDAEPDHKEVLASESIIPLLLALATGYFWLGGGIFNPWNAVWGACAVAIFLFAWFWSSSRSKHRPQRRHNALKTA